MSMFRLIKASNEGGARLVLVRVRAGRLIWGWCALGVGARPGRPADLGVVRA